MRFLPYSMEEEKEQVCFCFDVGEKKSLKNLREERKIDRLRVLLEIGELLPWFEKYRFSLAPENLYYDRNYRVFVKNRDLYEKGMRGEEEDALAQYKALAGYTMQKRYSYEDYYAGGRDLYKKNSFLKSMDAVKDIQGLQEFLKEEYEKTEKIVKNQRVEVNKSWYRMNRLGMTVAGIVIAAAVGSILFLMLVLLPRKNALLAAAGNYLEEDYVQVIDDLKKVDMKYLNQYQKYMLSVAYVKSESLTPEQKGNVLETLQINGEEKLKDYWIYLGRLNTAEAENIAMQRSDDELLLYAYMTEKAILEKNTEISGEEKTQRLQELEKKIEELAEQYQEGK
uniref:Type VII secretion protein EssB n=1 Tax=uncultured prokaryote TaxID=198431 RepID=A0A0H5QJG3_9ZZZZ|nr:hypothetical protein [uncultured prokaryote]